MGNRPNLPAEPEQGKPPPYRLHAKGPYTAVRLDTNEVHPLDSHSVMREVIDACEAVQEGMHSSQWAVGPLSRWGESLTFLEQRILDLVPLPTA